MYVCKKNEYVDREAQAKKINLQTTHRTERFKSVLLLN
jgi:hypothetical protein